MTSHIFLLPLFALGAIAAAPPLDAASGERTTQTERRLRACLSSNATGGHATLEAAILSTRAACTPQINDLRDARVIAATAGMEPDAALAVERRVTRELNNEVAHAIANFSGLPLPDAQNR